MVSNYHETTTTSGFGLPQETEMRRRSPPGTALLAGVSFGESPKAEARSPDLLCGFLRPLCQRGQERVCGWRRRDVSVQQGFEGDHAVVEFAGAVFVLLHDGAVQADAGERAAGAGVSQHLRAHLPIRAAFGMASNGAGCHRGIRAQFKLAG